MNYTAFKFLQVMLSIQLPCSVARLLHDVAVVAFNSPLPGHLCSWAIILCEMVLSHLAFASSSCLLGVVVSMDRDTDACAHMAPMACSRYKQAAMLGLLAFIFSHAIALLLFYLQASRHAQG